jgi:hypothetical protein
MDKEKTFDNFDLARFWSKVDVKGRNECWEWMAARRTSGHGDFAAPYGSTPAHRFAYRIFNGPPPNEMLVRHKCDNPACCNPLHLELGTHAENVSDRVARGRSASGEKNGRAKLTMKQVKEIRTSPLEDWALAMQYKVTIRAIEFVRQGVTWKSV